MKILLDENIEREVGHRLRNDDHEVVHVDHSDELSKGDTDEDLAAFSREHEFVIVTYDDDFRDFPDDAYHAVLFLADQRLSAKSVADILHEVSTYFDDLDGFKALGRSWL